MWLDRKRYPQTDGESPLTVAIRAEDERLARSKYYVPTDEEVREELERREREQQEKQGE